jgi:hypothetical protein
MSYAPGGDKENARLIVSQIVLDTFDRLEMTYPETSAERRQELQSIRKRLAMEIWIDPFWKRARSTLPIREDAAAQRVASPESV